MYFEKALESIKRGENDNSWEFEEESINVDAMRYWLL